MMNGNPKKRVCAAVLTEGAVHICNLYNLTTNQQAIRDFVALTHDSIGNLEPTLDVHPDRPAPVARNTDGGLELARLT